MIVIVMGVSGAGKTTVGALLAGELGWPFYDGDQLHPPANIEKMSRGLSLTDEDRWPWLERLRDRIVALAAEGRSAVVACSALKAAYRDLLLAGSADARIVYLKASYDLIDERLRSRRGHFFDPGLLATQFEALEEPEDVVVIDVRQRPERIVLEIRRRLGLEEGAEDQGHREPDQPH
jgi:gluconokinase